MRGSDRPAGAAGRDAGEAEHEPRARVLRAPSDAQRDERANAKLSWPSELGGVRDGGGGRGARPLLATGQIEATLTGYTPVGEGSVVDTRRDADAAHALRLFWSEVALERLKAAGAQPCTLMKTDQLRLAFERVLECIPPANDDTESEPSDAAHSATTLVAELVRLAACSMNVATVE